MRTISSDRDVPDDRTAAQYLEEALDGEWTLNTEYLGNRADMERAWTLQNELRAGNGLRLLSSTDLDDACGHFEIEGTP